MHAVHVLLTPQKNAILSAEWRPVLSICACINVCACMPATACMHVQIMSWVDIGNGLLVQVQRMMQCLPDSCAWIPPSRATYMARFITAGSNENEWNYQSTIKTNECVAMTQLPYPVAVAPPIVGVAQDVTADSIKNRPWSDGRAAGAYSRVPSFFFLSREETGEASVRTPEHLRVASRSLRIEFRVFRQTKGYPIDRSM